MTILTLPWWLWMSWVILVALVFALKWRSSVIDRKIAEAEERTLRALQRMRDLQP